MMIKFKKENKRIKLIPSLTVSFYITRLLNNVLYFLYIFFFIFSYSSACHIISLSLPHSSLLSLVTSVTLSILQTVNPFPAAPWSIPGVSIIEIRL